MKEPEPEAKATAKYANSKVVDDSKSMFSRMMSAGRGEGLENHQHLSGMGDHIKE